MKNKQKELENDELILWEHRNPYWEDEEHGQKALSELRVLFKKAIQKGRQIERDEIKKKIKNLLSQHQEKKYNLYIRHSEVEELLNSLGEKE
jgi:hypothetical protein